METGLRVSESTAVFLCPQHMRWHLRAWYPECCKAARSHSRSEKPRVPIFMPKGWALCTELLSETQLLTATVLYPTLQNWIRKISGRALPTAEQLPCSSLQPPHWCSICSCLPTGIPASSCGHWQVGHTPAARLLQSTAGTSPTTCGIAWDWGSAVAAPFHFSEL